MYADMPQIRLVYGGMLPYESRPVGRVGFTVAPA